MIPIFGWLYHFLKDKKFGPITIVGKASFDIFLVQMIYYKFFSDIPEKLTSSTPLLLVIHIIVCVAVGIILYYIEKPVTKKITGIAVKVVEKLHVLTKRMDK